MIRLFRLLVPASILTLFLSEAALTFGAYVLVAYFGRDKNGNPFLDDPSGWQRIGMLTALILASMFFRQLYGDLRVRSRILLLQQLAFVMGIVFLAEALIGYWNLNWALPRWILLPGSALVVLVIFLWRMLFSVGIQNKVGLRRVLFVGFTPAVGQLTDYLIKHPEMGFAPVGYLESSDAPMEFAGHVPHLGTPAQLYSVLEDRRPDWLVVGKREEIDASHANEFLEMRFGGVQTEDAAGFFEKVLGRICATEVRPQDLIWSDGLQPDRVSMGLQSMYSTVFGLLIAIPLLPIAAIVALCSAGSAGPALLRERRLGMYGEPFTMYQFRCPQNGAGRLLRRFGLDQLPQIWNVIRGQMSFVGPEPDRPEFASRFGDVIPFYAQRTSVKPGMTGWAQINQLTDESVGDLVRRLEYDLYYVKNISPLLDMFVMLRALREVVLVRPESEAQQEGSA